MMGWSVTHGDCRDVMAGLDPDSVDSIVTDPPYGLSFMGKGWDHAVPGVEFWAEALRVAKPGAHLLAFGGTRTFHRLAVAIEDAGWEVRDCLSWLYGSGFPKSLDVSKAMDKAAGKLSHEGKNMRYDDGTGRALYRPSVPRSEYVRPAAATELARQWQGWGTALKPAWEPIIMARKPLIGTVAANVSEHGTGGLNIEGCRVGTTVETWPHSRGYSRHDPGSQNKGTQTTGVAPSGRWPANVVLDEEAGAMLGEPSRFFYCAKASRAEREAGLEGLDERVVARSNGAQAAAGRGEEPGAAQVGLNNTHRAANHHPTVKPIALMRWLCRLVTPPGGLVLDPFTGSGTTGCAAVAEGFRFHGIELSDEYAEIARRRIAHHVPEPVLGIA